MSIIEYTSRLTIQRIERKHTKYTMAHVLFKTYHLLIDLRKTDLSDEVKKEIDDIAQRIAWG